ncbi:MAG: amidohydrolase [Bacteroidetes bacterium]|nr:amidohydrolase [Bacteroidota bacterium]
MKLTRKTVQVIVAIVGGIVCLGLLVSFMVQTVDTLYYNGRIYTLDTENNVVEAFVVKGDRIVGVGSERWLRLRFNAKSEVNLEGKTVLPGFIDAHCHLLDLGLSKLTVNLEGAQSELEAVAAVSEYIKKNPGQYWIRGMGWNNNIWPTKKFPTASTLDEISGEHPVYLTRIDGHACWVNSLALRLARISKSTPDPKGGKIIRDHLGNPTGVLLDAAMELVTQHLPPPTDHELETAVRLAIDECLANGITTIHDMAIDQTHYNLYRKLIESEQLPLRIYASVDGRSELWDQLKTQGPIIGYGNNRLTIRAVKYFIDGSLGSRSAALREPYADDPTNRGITTMSSNELRRYIDEAVAYGFQVCLHAIGDRANGMALDVIEESIIKGTNRDIRFRVEHAQMVSPGDIQRFAKLGVIASIQPVQCISDMYWVDARVGHERVQWMFTWRSMIDAGVRVASGSDFPVEPVNPLLGIYAACTRKSISGLPQSATDIQQYFQLSPLSSVDYDAFSDGWYGKQKMSKIEAVRSFTSWAAYAGFEETIKGSIEVGKLADFIVISADLFEVPERTLPHIYVEQTFIGGKNIFTRR